MSSLSLKNLVKGDGVGWEHCRKWIDELEKYPERIQIPLCINKEQRNSVGIDLEPSDWTEHIKWTDSKEKIIDLVPKKGIWRELVN